MGQVLHGSAKTTHAIRGAARAGATDRARRLGRDRHGAPLLYLARDHAQNETGHAIKQDRPDALR